jgi:hypothetical protein
VLLKITQYGFIVNLDGVNAQFIQTSGELLDFFCFRVNGQFKPIDLPHPSPRLDASLKYLS